MSSGGQHFVSERKYDEDLGKAVKFTYSLEPLKANMTSFGAGVYILVFVRSCV